MQSLRNDENMKPGVVRFWVLPWNVYTHQRHLRDSVMSGASDYAVKPNQFPVFCLMDAIITSLKQVNVKNYHNLHSSQVDPCRHCL